MDDNAKMDFDSKSFLASDSFLEELTTKELEEYADLLASAMNIYYPESK